MGTYAYRGLKFCPSGEVARIAEGGYQKKTNYLEIYPPPAAPHSPTGENYPSPVAV